MADPEKWINNIKSFKGRFDKKINKVWKKPGFQKFFKQMNGSLRRKDKIIVNSFEEEQRLAQEIIDKKLLMLCKQDVRCKDDMNETFYAKDQSSTLRNAEDSRTEKIKAGPQKPPRMFNHYVPISFWEKLVSKTKKRIKRNNSFSLKISSTAMQPRRRRSNTLPSNFKTNKIQRKSDCKILSTCDGYEECVGENKKSAKTYELNKYFGSYYSICTWNSYKKYAEFWFCDTKRASLDSRLHFTLQKHFQISRLSSSSLTTSAENMNHLNKHSIKNINENQSITLPLECKSISTLESDLKDSILKQSDFYTDHTQNVIEDNSKLQINFELTSTDTNTKESIKNDKLHLCSEVRVFNLMLKETRDDEITTISSGSNGPNEYLNNSKDWPVEFKNFKTSTKGVNEEIKVCNEELYSNTQPNLPVNAYAMRNTRTSPYILTFKLNNVMWEMLKLLLIIFVYNIFIFDALEFAFKF